MIVVIMDVKIPRDAERARLKNAGNWVLIYGRRKTGKTFYVKKFMKWDEYFFATREGSVMRNDETLTFSEFFPLFKSLLGEKAIVVDEFHRLPPLFLEYLHSTGGAKGRLTLVSSTLWLSKKLMESKSPLLGLFYNVPFPIIDERDILANLATVSEKKERVEAAVYLREPILIPHYEAPLRGFLPGYLADNKLALGGLVGEIFREEEKHLSDVYTGIMHAVASGKAVSSEISSYLFSRKLIPKDNPGLIQRYLENLVMMGIFEKEQVWGRKKFMYAHTSPLLDLYFYADEKYGLSERQVPDGFILAILDEKLPLHVERFVKALASKAYGLPSVNIDEPEIDFALTSFKRIKVVGEVKWGKVTAKDVTETEKKLAQFDAERLLVVPEKAGLPRSKLLTILEPADLLKRQ